MKILTTTLFLLGVATEQAKACIRVHAFLHNSALEGDTMIVSVYENGREVCHDAINSHFASSETVWKPDCPYPYKVQLWDNGQSGEVENERAKYKAELLAQDFKYTDGDEVIAANDKKKRGLKWSDWESVLWDAHDTCSEACFNTKVCGDSTCDINDKDSPDICMDFWLVKLGCCPD